MTNFCSLFCTSNNADKFMPSKDFSLHSCSSYRYFVPLHVFNRFCFVLKFDTNLPYKNTHTQNEDITHPHLICKYNEIDLKHSVNRVIEKLQKCWHTFEACGISIMKVIDLLHTYEFGKLEDNELGILTPLLVANIRNTSRFINKRSRNILFYL